MRLVWSNLSLFCLCLGLLPTKIYSTFEIIDPLGQQVDSFEEIEVSREDTVMEGFIALADPPDACSAIEKPSFLTDFTLLKFVLIDGAELCNYESKINNAEKAAFDFAVIFIDPNSTSDQHLGSDFNISVALISFEDRLKIKNYYLYNTSSVYNYRLRRFVIDHTLSFTNFLKVVGVVLGFVVLMKAIQCIAALPELLINKIRMSLHRRRNRIRTVKFAEGDKYDACVICLEDYKEGDKLKILPCSHAYHPKCIKHWLLNQRKNCPLCAQVPLYISDDESNSEDSGIFSSSENVPILTSSSSNPGRNWGTFQNQMQNQADTSGPSSMPDNFQDDGNSMVAENPHHSDTEVDNLSHSPQSVNNDNNAGNASLV